MVVLMTALILGMAHWLSIASRAVAHEYHRGVERDRRSDVRLQSRIARDKAVGFTFSFIVENKSGRAAND